MTYVSKRVFIFDLPDKLFPDCCLPRAKRSDARLKRFSSILDDRIWSTDEKERYRYLYDMMSGSQSCLSRFSCFKYVPLEALVKILLAEREAYIKCLEHRLGILEDTDAGPSRATPAIPPPAPSVVRTEEQRPCKPEEIPVERIFKARTFVDDEDQDVIAMRDKIASLKAELEECKLARDTLRQAMHKLEDIEEIVNENESLKAKLRCSDEMIKYLNEKKGKLEEELKDIRTKSQIQLDLEEVQDMLRSGDQLAEERDHLQRRVEELQFELTQARTRRSEMELLRKQSESASLSLEEITRENECYKKKLSSMKDLEKQIEELKKKASQIADKYKRDTIKACDQNKQMKEVCRELGLLREERDRLRRRVAELACYEQQYNCLQTKLKQVDNILAENAMLNCKLASLDKLELENQFLKCKLEQCQASEIEAEESKEKITELENAVADQEEEMKDLLCQIERLTRTYGDSSELDRLKEELSRKEYKLRLCEEQLSEIPLLEAEVDELRCKLENCYNNITRNPPQDVQAFPHENPDKAIIIDSKYEECISFEGKTVVCSDIQTEMTQLLEKTDREKELTFEEIQDLLLSSKSIISCVLEDMIKHQREMEDLEKCNREMNEEIVMLKARIGKTDMDDFFQEMRELKILLCEKEKKISCMEEEIAKVGDLGKVNNHISCLEREIDCLKDLNRKMRADLQEACCEVQRCAELECLLEQEKRARTAAEAAAKRTTKSQKEEYNIEAKESLNDVDSLRSRIEELNKLVKDLKEENSMLKRESQWNPDYEKNMEEKVALENLLNLLQCELDACRNERSTDETKALRNELNRLRDQNTQLKSLACCYKERLDLEKCSKRGSGSRKLGSAEAEENKKLKAHLAQMEKCLTDLCRRLEDCEKRYREKSAEFDLLVDCYRRLAKKNEEPETVLNEEEKQPEQETEQSVNVGKPTVKFSTANDDGSKYHDKQPNETRVGEETEKYSSANDDRGQAEEPTEAGTPSKTDKFSSANDDRGQAEEPTEAGTPSKTDKFSSANDSRGQAEERTEAGTPSKTDKFSSANDSRGQAEERTEAGTPSKTDKFLSGNEDIKSQGKNSNKAGIPSNYEKDLKDKKAIESAIRNVEEEVDGLTVKFEERGKAEQERDDLLKKQANMQEELEKLRNQLANCMQSRPGEKVNTKEEKLLEEMVGLREQAEQTKAENKKLKQDLDKLKQLLDECNKARSNEEAQASLMSAKQEGMSYPVQPAPKAVPQTVIPIKEEQRASVLERGQQEKMQEPEKASIIDAIPNEVKVVVESKPKAEKPSHPGGGPSDESIVSFSDLDPGYSKFVCTLNPFDHRQNVCEVERRYREMMTDLKEKNEEKIKRLLDQQKKESAMRDKSYNENLSSMRAGYESDIRKLVDRHKASILRLQSLHEDDVRQMNENYESQLLAMQTQNENVVNDLTTGAAKKFKTLVEQHNRDLRELETNYQKLIEGKEEEHAQSMGGTDAGDVGSKFERELKRLKKSNLKKVDIMQQKYEKLLTCERKKYERQLEETIKKLKQGKGVADGVCQCSFPICINKNLDAPLEFNDVLQKILTFGLESLSFNEVALVHSLTCSATGDIVLSPEKKAQLLPAIAEQDVDQDSLMKANKKELLNRILVLENEIAIKQMETQDAIVNMELAVKAERKRLQELRDSLRQEQEKNSDLNSKLSHRPMSPMLPAYPMGSMQRKVPAEFERKTQPKICDQLQCMPPTKIEDIIPRSRQIAISGTDTQDLPGRAQIIAHKLKELQNKCVCPQDAAEKDTNSKHKRESTRGRGKDTNVKHKVTVTSRKKGKK